MINSALTVFTALIIINNNPSIGIVFALSSSAEGQTLFIMEIEYTVKKEQGTSRKRVIAWGCFAKCFYNWGTISKGSVAA